ncbi:hypothetical protein [Labilithrix luteola]|uniref:hypothetical protein n=1 Tax=Labilithrix luteola TaxID=1391654 RepID=UPI001969BB2D|nr:hypothetical protein [Labilithrix luteola]
MLVPAVAHADEAAAPAAAAVLAPASSGTFPQIGGHVGFALPLVTLAKDTTVIGGDFVTVGLTPGITVKLSERWKVDFEFIALNELKRTPTATTFVVDPGVIYDAGPLSAGLRVATQVGAPSNIGVVPIVVLPFKGDGPLTPYIEADVPLFLRDNGTSMQPSASLQFQAGVAF